ncbi:hypothetical protein Mal15_06100 [Stieleria maiorica]|uniref:Uncharacterized protein n=1 Tax=Stieleria maiorica TaxID=2795974 RepID=A0A5B9M689_9BACT|nr:hypothetical protein [Stieleria maiorica]QEF96582.1 hypothetical protein Mal15_06100 [Stieleria maiorica]
MAISPWGLFRFNHRFFYLHGMNQFTKRLLIFAALVVGFASMAAALSQMVTYKPWGVPDSKRDTYDKLLAAQEENRKLRQEYADKPRPQASTVVSSHDFGWMNPGESREFQFPIRNLGAVELTLQVRDVSDERISATLAREALAPGEETFCVVSLTAGAEAEGTLPTSTATIVTNDPLKQSIVLGVGGKITSELVVPEKISFGRHDITEAATAEFWIYSQRSEQIQLHDVSSDHYQIQWVELPPDPPAAELQGKSATAAIRVAATIQPKDYGKYTDSLKLTVGMDGIKKHVEVAFDGRVRPPIAFYGPEVDRRSGVDFGTINRGTKKEIFVVVRSRGDSSRRIEVLDYEPKDLEVEMQPQSTEGTYRLRLCVPADCPKLQFNMDSHRGYVSIGDPDAEAYSNWLPIYVQVVDVEKKK